MISKDDADELIKYLRENSFPSQYGNRILIKDVIHKINAMVEPDSPEMVTCPRYNGRKGYMSCTEQLDRNGTGEVTKDSR